MSSNCFVYHPKTRIQLPLLVCNVITHTTELQYISSGRMKAPSTPVYCTSVSCLIFKNFWFVHNMLTAWDTCDNTWESRRLILLVTEVKDMLCRSQFDDQAQYYRADRDTITAMCSLNNVLYPSTCLCLNCCV